MLDHDPATETPARRFDLEKWMAIILTVMATWACANPGASELSKFESFNYMQKPVNHKELAEEYYQKEQYEKAKSELRLVLVQNPKDADAHYRMGVIYGKEGAVKESLFEFERVITIDPEYSKAYFNLGVIYSRENAPESIGKSIEYFDKYLELVPGAAQKDQIERYKAYHSKEG